MRALLTLTVLCAILFSCSTKEEHKVFAEAKNSGVDFTNTISSSTDLNILNYLYFYNGAGTAIADFNNDGLLDIYLTANQETDKLFLNQGELKFDDITKASGIVNASGWTTGVTSVDINADGLMDLYISKVSGHLDLEGHNLLYINQGVVDGIPQFKELSANYGLNYSGLSTQSIFFDYDLDGDLDVFLLNHSLYPNANYTRGAARTKQDSIYGDKLFRNDQGNFLDVTAQSGLYSSKIGYGLGVSAGDLNQDGYPDLFIGNDFFENDYIYINQKDGTFKEINSTQSILGHSSHFTMGTEMADINNDALPDLLSLDMLPENLETLKKSGVEYAYPIYQNQLRYGYEPQFMQNALHFNLGNNSFVETAFLSGLSATEWSWCPLVADFDNDGFKDVFITNGILGATNDMDFVNFISESSIQKQLGANMTEDALSYIKKLPTIHEENYIFRNQSGSNFENVSDQWLPSKKSYSNGAAYGDLDNDGDLDLVINNVNEAASVLINQSRQKEASHYLKINFKGNSFNSYGIGAKVYLYNASNLQYHENYTTRGYLSAVPPQLYFGLGSSSVIDSLRVIWPTGEEQTLKNIQADTSITLDQGLAKITQPKNTFNSPSKSSLTKTDSSLIDFKHRDGTSIEFSRDPLVPYASTNLGPETAVADFDKNGEDDLIVLGAKGQSTLLYKQINGVFKVQDLPSSEEYELNEDTAIAIIDANNDSWPDVLIASGGNEFQRGIRLQPRLYINDQNGGFYVDDKAIPTITINASSAEAIDFNQDGFTDLAVTANLVPQEFGVTPRHYLLQNKGNGLFTDITSSYAPDLLDLGNVLDMVWKDLDQNGFPDVIFAGHWMPISIFYNDGKRLLPSTDSSLEDTHGWWNTLEVSDFDQDGDLDLVAGNWGLNTRLTASQQQPLQLYRNDFDKNGKIDPLVTYFYQGSETLFVSKDELVKQLPSLNKEFLSYSAFAKANLEQLFTSEQLQAAERKKVYQLASIYFENKGNNTFKSHQLPFLAQTSSVFDLQVDDFNNDGFQDLFLVGNNYEISTQLGRLDGLHGLLLLNDTNGFFKPDHPQPLTIPGASRSIDRITINNQEFYVIGRNNEQLLFIKKNED